MQHDRFNNQELLPKKRMFVIPRHWPKWRKEHTKRINRYVDFLIANGYEFELRINSAKEILIKSDITTGK